VVEKDAIGQKDFKSFADALWWGVVSTYKIHGI